MATYFIRIDTYWQNSLDRFVGPFASRDEAQAEIDHATNAENSRVVLIGQSASDIKTGIRCHGILSKTSATRHGMTERNTLSMTIPLNTADLTEHEDLYLAY